ncbi:ATP12 family chaperone protein [Maricaulis sp. W15]|uniref:ATP12 family chaperone protein n=1 Tax=Maricaulis sp. W15 TaxID=1772333 RepID=UPI00094913AB|nr:ATP12 family protein [Maricaulis sp. W15]
MSQTYETKPGVKIPSRESALPKRFYTDVTVVADGEVFAVHLDGRPVKSPAKQALALPTRALAELVAAEWAAQGERIDAPSMPATRLCFVALDLIPDARAETVAEVTKYASTDLVCFRAPEPPALAASQAAAWDPIIAWAESALGAHFVPATGLMPLDQDPVALQRVMQRAGELDDWRLTTLAHVTAVCGSALIALALLGGEIDGEKAFVLSTLDEHFQISQWGEDHEAADRLARLRTELVVMGEVLRALDAASAA